MLPRMREGGEWVEWGREGVKEFEDCNEIFCGKMKRKMEKRDEEGVR